MEQALMKLEPEVIADPRGTAVNRSLVQPSLGPEPGEPNGTLRSVLKIHFNPAERSHQQTCPEPGLHM